MMPQGSLFLVFYSVSRCLRGKILFYTIFSRSGAAMKEQDVPVTTAVRALRAAGVSFTPHLYDYAEHGGTGQVAQVFGVDEHMVVKTLVMEAQEAGRRKHFLVLMHGDREVSTKQLARLLEVKAVSPASVAEVEKSTGYV